jgi:hypothetical protein
VIVTGSGTTAAEELVIVDAFILAYGLSARLRPVWKGGAPAVRQTPSAGPRQKKVVALAAAEFVTRGCRAGSA